MKKNSWLLLLLLIPAFTNAQKTTVDANWNAEAGPILSVPIRYMHYFTVFGIGADVAANRGIIDRLYGGGRMNYTYFFGKGSIEGEDYNLGLFNAMADVYYLFDFKMLLGFSGGLGLTFNTGVSDANFSRVFYAGYLFNTQHHDYVITAFFDQTNYQKNIGIRACIRLPVSSIFAGKKKE
ncbi:MAG: hypothetical protein IPO83_08330 [Chitinophagaceae bacterium]|nr:hypothetical protein [Chitinophagaceae bacterium]